MAGTTINVSGTVVLPNGIVAPYCVVRFTLNNGDADTLADVTYIPAPVEVTADVNGVISIDLWPNDLSTRSTYYSIDAVITTGRIPVTYHLGTAELVDGPDVKFEDIISFNDVIFISGDSFLVSVIKGEQIHMDMTLKWLTSLSGYTVTAKVVEADMAGVAAGEHPTIRKVGGQVTTLTLIDATVTDNTFKIVIPATLIDSWTTQPTAQSPTYGWIGIEVSDSGAGSAQQIWKPLSGLIEVVYNPSEET